MDTASAWVNASGIRLLIVYCSASPTTYRLYYNSSHNLPTTTTTTARSRHSGDWLMALPITSCGLKLDDEAVRVAVGTRLALKLCIPHQCRCGSEVDSFGRHSLVCKRAPGRTVRHHHLNDVIARSVASAGVPVSKKPSGLSRSDGKRPDGLTLIPWRAGRSLI